MHTFAQWRQSPDGLTGSVNNPPQETKPKITFTGATSSEPIEARWKRPLNKTGTGATHVRTFTAKLSPGSLEYLDRHINDWLDAHPDCEVKFSTVQIGDVATSMGKEATLVVQVWI